MKLNIDQLNEIITCSKDPKYFIEKYVYVSNPIRGEIHAITNHDMLDIINFACDNTQKGGLVVDAERQTGKTTTLAIAALYYATFNSSKTIHIHLHSAKAAKEIIQLIRTLHSSLPIWMQSKFYKCNMSDIEFDNRCRITAGCNVNWLKGRAIQLLLVDEAALIKDLEEMFVVFMPMLATSGRYIVASSRSVKPTFFDKMCTSSKNVIHIERLNAT